MRVNAINDHDHSAILSLYFRVTIPLNRTERDIIYSNDSQLSWCLSSNGMRILSDGKCYRGAFLFLSIES